MSYAPSGSNKKRRRIKRRQVMLPLYFIKHNAMKTYGRVEVWRHHS
jgi:hypothetical protein